MTDGMFKAVCNFHAGAIAVFKTIKSKSYDHVTRTWSFHVRDHDELAKALSAVGGITVKALPANVIKALGGASDAGAGSSGGQDGCLALSDEQAESKLQQLPPDLLSSLMPFQRAGVKVEEILKRPQYSIHVTLYNEYTRALSFENIWSSSPSPTADVR
jgi:hypothetical protein